MIFMRPGDAACPGRAAGAGGLLAAPAAGPGISPGISPGIMTALAAELRLRGSLRPRPGAGAGRIGGGEQRPEPATVADALSFLPLSGICTGEQLRVPRPTNSLRGWQPSKFWQPNVERASDGYQR